MSDRALLPLVADIIAAYCRRNYIAVADLPTFVTSVFATLDGLGVEPPAAAPRREPAVPIRLSVKPDYLVCLEDGKKLKLLKRHLRTSFALTPDQYRAKWGLRSDYPMVAASYSTTRSKLAVASGFGRGRPAKGPPPQPVTTKLSA